MYEKEQKLNRSKRNKIIPRHKLTSPPYYRKEHLDEELEKRVHNFEPYIHYVVEQESSQN